MRRAPERGARWGVVTLALALGGCTKGSASAGPRELATVPPELASKVKAAEEAVGALQARLFQRLSAELEHAGPAGAVRVCREEAQGLTEAVARQQGLELGRTSHRLRNPRNAPRPWVAPYVAASAGLKAADVKPVVVDLGDRLGVLKPIPTAPLCTTCHGPAEGLPPEVARELKDGYPADAAVGFTPGDLRGYFWVEVRQ